MMKCLGKSILVLGLTVVLAACTTLKPADEKPAKAAELNFKLGVGYMQKGHFDVAKQKLKKAIEYGPRYAEAYNALGVLYEETGDMDAAEQNYAKAVDLDSGYQLARRNYARLLCRNGKYNEGEEQYQSLSEKAKQDVDGYTGAGVCARMKNDLGRAEAYFRKALEENPQDAGALLELAELSHEQGNAMQARAFLQRYHAAATYSPKSLWLGIAVEESLGDERLSREYARLLLSRFADSTEARRLTQPE